MVCKIRTVLAVAALAFTFGLQPPAHAQGSNAKTLETGTFHGKVHSTSGRATIYQEKDGKPGPPFDKLQDIQRARRTRDFDRGYGRGR